MRTDGYKNTYSSNASAFVTFVALAVKNNFLQRITLLRPVETNADVHTVVQGHVTEDCAVAEKDGGHCETVRIFQVQIRLCSHL